MATKLKAADLSRLILIVSVLILTNGFAVESMVAQERPHSCKAAKRKVDRKVIEADVEKYRRGESPTIESAYELINCTEAFPVLKKYVLDPDPKVRGLITDYLGRHFSQARLQLLVRQIELYPLKNAAMRYAYQYPCRSFNQIRVKSLTSALISRIKEDSGDVHGNEIYILGCLVARDTQARNFLEEMRLSSFQTSLDEHLRGYQLFAVNLALSEVDHPDAVRDAITRIDQVDKRGRYDELTSVVEDARKTSNVLILLRLTEFIRDKREGPSVAGGIRLGDVAAGVFTRKLGELVAGDKNNDQLRRHTDEELEAIYQRVKSYLMKHSPAVK